MEFVLRLPGRREGRSLQPVEVVRGLIQRRVEVRDLAVPEIELVGPRTQPVVLIQTRALQVRVALPGERIGPGAGYGAVVDEVARRLEDARGISAEVAPAIVAGASAAATGRECQQDQHRTCASRSGGRSDGTRH